MRQIITFSLALLFSLDLGSTSIENRPTHEFYDILEKIQLLNYSKLYGYTDQELYMIASLIETTCRAYDVNQYLMIGIFEVESDFGTKKLRKTKGKPTDFGWGQLHIQHFNNLKLDGQRLLTDDAYSIERSVLFMKDIQKRYGMKELNFYSRYHSYTPKYRRSYEIQVHDTMVLLGVKSLPLGFQVVVPEPILCDQSTRGKF